MPTYIISWEASIAAKSPAEAAEKAMNILRNSTEILFDVQRLSRKTDEPIIEVNVPVKQTHKDFL